MIEEYDWDIYEIFKEQLDLQLPQIEAHILGLDKEELLKDSLDELFRFFHTYKASSAYLELTPMHTLVSKAETVLGSLREENSLVSESIIEWLLKVEDQMFKYSNEMEKKETLLSPINPKILNGIKITPSHQKPIDILHKLPLLYVDKTEARAKKIFPILKKYASSVAYTKDLQGKNIDLSKYSIIICFLNDGDFELIDFIQEKYPNLPIMPMFSSVDFLNSKELIQKGISHFLEAPISLSNIERELLSIVKTFYSSNNILIDHKKINNFIQTLKPLPNTIFQIMQICDDEEIPIKDLIKTVKTDAVISANILKVANSPIYGSTELKTIDQAVSKFGKRSIKSLAMSGMHNSLGEINLSAYEINEDIFSEVSMKRLSLMIKWYSKVSIADLSLLSSTALLGNIGQLLISKEIIEIEEEDKFQELCKTFGIRYAEESLLHTNTNNISAQILRFWKLSPDIVDIIEYSDKPEDAPLEIRALSVANNIVSTLISIKGEVKASIPDELLPLMAEYNLNPELLSKALKGLQE